MIVNDEDTSPDILELLARTCVHCVWGVQFPATYKFPLSLKMEAIHGILHYYLVNIATKCQANS